MADTTDNWEGNPFGDGPGSMPPYLAGRDEHLAKLDIALEHFERATQGRRTFRWPILVGPRGTGKTVLLQAFRSRITARLPDARIVYTVPSEYHDPETLIATIESDFGIVGNPARLLGDRLVDCCRHKPVAILLDEAHTMEWPDAQTLLGVFQKVCQEAPMLPVLAGTPHLTAVLKAANASFEERADRIGVGALDDTALRDAIRIPFANHSPALTIEPDILAAVAAAADGYPFFAALWGSALYEAMRLRSQREADAAIFEAAAKSVDDRRRLFYGRRYDEIAELGLLGIAAGLADAFADTRPQDADTVRKSISFGNPNAAAGMTPGQALEALVDLGYIWLPPGSEAYEAGIPSLMSYVRERAIDRPASRP